jgi:CHASE3 domain sensor protein
MDKEQIKAKVEKEAQQLKDDYEKAAKDAVPFFQKNKKAVIVTGVVIVVVVLALILIF